LSKAYHGSGPETLERKKKGTAKYPKSRERRWATKGRKKLSGEHRADQAYLEEEGGKQNLRTTERKESERSGSHHRFPFASYTPSSKRRKQGREMDGILTTYTSLNQKKKRGERRWRRRTLKTHSVREKRGGKIENGVVVGKDSTELL